MKNIESQYGPKYKITKKQLEHLTERLKKLSKLAIKICREKIESFVFNMGIRDYGFVDGELVLIRNYDAK